MDEEKYKEALLEARAVLEPCLKYSNGKVREALDSIDKELKSFESEDEMIRMELKEAFEKTDLDMIRNEAIERIKARFDKWALDDEDMKAIQTLIPELRESDDERIRKLLVWQVYRNIEDETNDLAQSVYDGIKGHDPDLEESIEDWKRCLAYLEKQKEQDWNKKPCLTCQEYEKGHKQGYTEGCTAGYNKAMKEVGQKEQKPVSISCGHENDAEWSEEDEKMLRTIISDGSRGVELDSKQIAWLKSLRPSWKPSEEHLSALLAIFNDPNNIGSQTCQLALTDLYEQLKKL